MKFILLVSKNIGKFVSFVPCILVVLINGINLHICWSLKMAMGKHIRPLRDIDTTSLSKILRQYEYMSHLSYIFKIILFLVKVKLNGHTWIITISPSSMSHPHHYSNPHEEPTPGSPPSWIMALIPLVVQFGEHKEQWAKNSRSWETLTSHLYPKS